MKFFNRVKDSQPQVPQMPQGSYSVEDVVEMAGKCSDEAKAGLAIRLASTGKIEEAMRMLGGRAV
jgi:hypothetical protein